MKQEDARPLPAIESIYRDKCPDGDRCLHGCHRSESCHYVASSPGEREYASWRPRGGKEDRHQTFRADTPEERK